MSAGEAVVLSCVGGRYRVYAQGEPFLASMRGRIKQQPADRVLVGDRVVVHRHDDESATIESVLARRSLLRRRGPGRSSGVRAVAANIDQVIVVGAIRQPEWDPHMIDRFIAVAEASDLPVVVLLNKADLAEEAEELLEIYRAAGYATLVSSVPDSRGLEAFRALLAGRVSLLTGPSGAGKSSLLNLIEPGLRLRTGEVSARGGTGRHTTVSAEMHPLREGGFVVDTPGLRDIGLWGLAPADVAGAFPELRRLSLACHFDNCRHMTEPGCAVVEAVEQHRLSRSRLDSYRRLLEEASLVSRPWA